MRQTHRKISMLVVAPLCTWLFSCTHGQLDRDTAEKMIREKNQRLGDPFVLTLHSPTWVDGAPSRPDATRQSNLEFLDKLAKAGVIRWQPEEKVPVGTVNGSFVPGAETVREFQGIAQENVVQRQGRPYEGDWVDLTLAVPEVKQVTGITQQEATAIAEVAVSLKPTPMYDRLQPLVADLIAGCGGVPTDSDHATDPRNFAVSAICRSWPTQQNLTSSHPYRFMFQKFDDGWRLVEQVN
jgi:hypothetical protein